MFLKKMKNNGRKFYNEGKIKKNDKTTTVFPAGKIAVEKCHIKKYNYINIWENNSANEDVFEYVCKPMNFKMNFK